MYFKVMLKHMPKALCLLPLLLLILSGCTGGSDGTYGDSGGFDKTDAVTDSIAAATRLDSGDTIPPEPPKITFSSSEEALEFMRNSPDRDRYERGILPAMARDVLPYAEKLLNNRHPRFIIVDKERMKVILYDRFGVQLESYGMACAKRYGTKHKKADSRTPEGFFEVEGIYDSTEWLFTDDNGVQSKKKGQFGPRFIRLRTPVSSQIGIHGTCAPWSIGGRSSHGCIRITNENILALVKLVEAGMPVIVSPGHKDIAVNESEGYDVPAVATVPGGRRASSKPPREEVKKDSVPSYPSAAEPAHSHADSGRHEAPPVSVPEPEECPDTVVGSVFD